MIKGMKFGMAVLAVSIVGAAGLAHAQDTLRAGIFINPPFGGTPPGGYCYDLMEEIAARTSLTFEYFPMVVGDLITKVGAGETDIECSALGPTPERRALGVVFTGPILTNQEAIVVRAGDATAYVSLADFQGLKTGAAQGSANFTQLSNAGLNVTAFPSSTEGMAALLAGEIDAYMTAAPEAMSIAQTEPGLRMVDTYVATRIGYGMIGVHEGNISLLGTVQNALENMKADGSLAEIAGRWGIPLPPF